MLLVNVLLLCGSIVEEAKALKSWLDTPFSSVALERERDAKVSELQNPVKGEFETTAAFEQRKANLATSRTAITKEYEQKIADARAGHAKAKTAMQDKIRSLIAQSRQTLSVSATLGSYDADSQKFRLTIPEKTFEVVVPLDKAPQVRNNFGSYSVKVTRQLDENLTWKYLEASIEGSAGIFASTDKASAMAPVAQGQSLVPPALEATVSFGEPSGNNLLDAEEKAELTIRIKNTGKGSAYMLEASFSMPNASGISFPRTLYFGEIKAGETQTKSLQLIAGNDVKDAEVLLNISFTEQNGFPPNDKVLKFGTKALLPPDIYVSDIGIDDQSKNGKIEPGEQVELRIRIHNRGAGTAKNLIAEVLRGEGVFFFGDNINGTFVLGDLPSGAYKDINCAIITARTATKLDLKLDLKESRNQFSKMNQSLNLAFNRQERSADQMVIAGKNTQTQIASAPSLSIDIEADIPQRGKANPKRWGVIIGIENYRNVSSVRFARRDAEYVKEYFTKVLGIPMENIYVKTDDAATLSEFKTLFDAKGWLQKNASAADNEIFIYYSGHGAPDPNNKKAYLLPSDGNPNYASISGYEMQQLYDNLGSLKVKHITLFLDSCFSGANRENEIILADARPVFISAGSSALAKHVSVFSAASGAQISSAYADMQHGLFSYFLMKGLRGDADSNSDRKITHAELNAYLRQNVSAMARRMGREQEPELQSSEAERIIIQW